MKSTNVYRVMSPILGRYGHARWHHPLIVAVHDKEAIRVAEQVALKQGFSFSGDIMVQLVAHATTEDGE